MSAYLSGFGQSVCLSSFLPICLPYYLSDWLSGYVYWPIYLSDWLSGCPFICLSFCMSFCLSYYLSDGLTIWISVCISRLFVFVFACLSYLPSLTDYLDVCQSVWQSVWMSIYIYSTFACIHSTISVHPSLLPSYSERWTPILLLLVFLSLCAFGKEFLFSQWA